MSNYRGHVVGSAISAIVYLIILSLIFAIDILPSDRDVFSGYAFPIVIVALVILFGIFPDIDINSHAQKFFYSLFFIGDLWLIATKNFRESAYIGLLIMLPVLSKHRGWTHSKRAMVIVPLPLLILPAINYPDDPWVGLVYYGAAVVGYTSHLVLDRELL